MTMFLKRKRNIRELNAVKMCAEPMLIGDPWFGLRKKLKGALETIDVQEV
jgi:hypothetical protein